MVGESDLPQATGVEPERRSAMSMSRAVLLVSLVYLAVKVPIFSLCYAYRESMWRIHPSTLIPIGIASAWLLPMVVLVGTVAWQWKARDFRWLSVVVFIVWMAGLAYAETGIWGYFVFGPTGEISPI